jgi:hypothetical protein
MQHFFTLSVKTDIWNFVRWDFTNVRTDFYGPLLCSEWKYEDGDIVDVWDRVMNYMCYMFVMGLVSVLFLTVWQIFNVLLTVHYGIIS